MNVTLEGVRRTTDRVQSNGFYRPRRGLQNDKQVEFRFKMPRSLSSWSPVKGDRIHYNLKNKSSHSGFIDCIKAIFFSRSKFVFVKPPKTFSLCCFTRFFKSLVTPTYKVPFLLLNRMHAYPFFCMNWKVQKEPLKNNGFKWLGFYRPRRGLQNDKKVISRRIRESEAIHRPSWRHRVSWTSPGQATSRRGWRLRG